LFTVSRVHCIGGTVSLYQYQYLLIRYIQTGMGLFSTLDNQPDQVGNHPSTSSTSLSLPTVVQLYTDEPFRLEQSVAQLPSYAALTYQAVSVLVTDLSETLPVLSVRTETHHGLRHRPPLATEPVPDLGVWSCRVIARTAHHETTHDAATLTDALLRIPHDSNAVFAFTVDLRDPARVEPTLTRLQDALVRYLIHRDEPNNDPHADALPVAPTTTTTTTTSLDDLRSVAFGTAPHDDDSVKAVPETKDRTVRVTLAICARMPADDLDTTYTNNSSNNKSNNDPPAKEEAVAGYHAKQTQNLIYYHLRRYAAALNASLIFVDESTSSTTDKGTALTDRQPTVSLPQLAFFLRELARGKALWLELEQSARTNDEDDSNDESNAQAPTPESAHAIVYGPGSHQEDLIESVWLRNAQYPGHWDAAKDPVWKILPPPPLPDPSAIGKRPPPPTGTVGDEAWLTELRDSVATVTDAASKTPPPKNKSGVNPAAGTTPVDKTPNEKDVSNFFESLLKTK
jgi:hypothetical protein